MLEKTVDFEKEINSERTRRADYMTETNRTGNIGIHPQKAQQDRVKDEAILEPEMSQKYPFKDR